MIESDDTDLPRSGLADDADGFAGAHLEGNLLDPADLPVAGLEADGEILDLDDRSVQHGASASLRLPGHASGRRGGGQTLIRRRAREP